MSRDAGGGAGSNVGGNRFNRAAVLTIIIGFLLNQYKDEVRSIFQSMLLNLVRTDWIDKERLNQDIKFVIELEDSIKEIHQKLPEDRLTILNSLKTHYIRLLNQGQASHFIANFRLGIQYLLQLPVLQSKPISQEQLDGVKQKVAKDYPQIYTAINAYVNQLAAFLSDHENNPKPNPLLLMGPAGVGKTRLVIEVLSKELKLPVYQVQLANQRRQTLTGEADANLCNSLNPGVLFRALTHAAREGQGALPVIVFFDDICTAFTKQGEKVEEQEVISWLTEMFDPDLKAVNSHLFDRYISSTALNGLKIDLKNFIFIAAANRSHFISTPGLARRLRSQIIFPAMTKEEKRKIAKSYMQLLESKLMKTGKGGELTLSDESEADLKKIVANDNFPGVSTIKDCIEKYYTNKKMGDALSIENYYAQLDAPSSAGSQAANTGIFSTNTSNAKERGNESSNAEQVSPDANANQFI